MNALLEKLLKSNPDFKISLSITGTFIEQCEQWAPDVLESFKRLVATGQVEIIAETYYHSLAFFYSRSEFEHQVEAHKAKIRELFGLETNVFRNTELAYNDELAHWAEERVGFLFLLNAFDNFILRWFDGIWVDSGRNRENLSFMVPFTRQMRRWKSILREIFGRALFICW